MRELISIIVPVYNIENYIETCIKSLINQTYSNIEIILVDDGSTDNSIDICNHYRDIDERVVVIHKEANEGLVAARKTGLIHSSGTYILNVDGDDWISPNMCEALINKAIEYDCDIVASSFHEMEKDGTCIDYLCDEQFYDLAANETNRIYLLESWLKDQMNCKIHNTIWSKLFKKDIFEKVYSLVPNNKSLGEDMISLIYILAVSKNIYVMSEAYYYYRLRKSSLSHLYNRNIFVKSNRLDDYLYSLILDTLPKVDIDILDDWYVNRKKNLFYGYNNELMIYRKVFFIPNVEKIEGRIILYGAGKVGNDYYRQLSMYERINIVAWVDKEPIKYNYQYCKIEDLSRYSDNEYEKIIIAVASEKLSDEIREELITKGINPNKIMWIEPQKKKMRFILEDNKE